MRRIAESKWKHLYFFKNKIKHTFTLESNHSNPRYLPRRNENTFSYEDLFTNVHNSLILCKMAKSRKQPRHPSAAEWVSKFLYTKRFSQIKSNKLLINHPNLNESRNMQNERIQKRKQYTILLIYMKSGAGKIICHSRKQLVAAWGRGEGTGNLFGVM